MDALSYIESLEKLKDLFILGIILYAIATAKTWITNIINNNPTTELPIDIEKNLAIDDSIMTARIFADADRALFYQYHNGSYFSKEISFQKVSLTHDKHRTGLASIYNRKMFNNIPIYALTPFIKDLKDEVIVATEFPLNEKYENCTLIIPKGIKYALHMKVTYRGIHMGFITIGYSSIDKKTPEELTGIAKYLDAICSEIGNMFYQELSYDKRKKRKWDIVAKFKKQFHKKGDN